MDIDVIRKRLFDMFCNKGIIQSRQFENPLKLRIKDYYDYRALSIAIINTIIVRDIDTGADKITVYNKVDLNEQIKRI